MPVVHEVAPVGIKNKTYKGSKNKSMDGNLGSQPKQTLENFSAHRKEAIAAIKAFAFLGWVAVIMAAYYVVHKPNIELAALQGMIDLLLASSIAGITGALGYRILGTLTRLGDLERAALQLAVGAGIMGLVILAIGLLGILTPWIAWLGLIIGLIALRKEIAAWLGQFKILQSLYQQSDILGRFAGWISALALAASLTYALAPALKWDSLVYHLELPKQYLDAGRILFLDDNFFSGFPQLAEMFFTWSMALRSGTTAAVTGWIFGIVAILGVGGFAARIVGNQYALLSLAILLSGESIAQSLGWAYVDVWAMLFGLCVIITLDRYTSTRKRFWLVWAGILTGFAMGTKYPAYILLVLGAALLLFDHFLSPWFLSFLGKASSSESALESEKDLGRGHFLSDLLPYVGLALLFALPWLARNFITSGNPVSPFFFPDRAVDGLRQSFYSGLTPVRSLLDDLLLPWNATVLGIEGGVGFNTSIGPLLLALIPGLLLYKVGTNRAQLRSLLALCIFAGGVWIIWAAGTHISEPLASSRLYFFSFPALAVLAVAGFSSAMKVKILKIRIGRVAGILIGLSLGLGLINQASDFRDKNPLSVILGSISQETYLNQNLGWYFPVMQAVNNLPQTSRTLFLWEARAYYCTRDCSPDVVLDRWWHLRRTIPDLSGISSWMKDQGYSHVLVYDIGAEFERLESGLYEEADWLDLQEFRQEHLTLLQSFDGIYTLYRLTASE